MNSLHIGEGYVEININEDVILISWLEDSAGSKPNPCTVRTHQEKREYSATGHWIDLDFVVELFMRPDNSFSIESIYRKWNTKHWDRLDSLPCLQFSWARYACQSWLIEIWIVIITFSLYTGKPN